MTAHFIKSKATFLLAILTLGLGILFASGLRAAVINTTIIADTYILPNDTESHGDAPNVLFGGSFNAVDFFKFKVDQVTGQAITNFTFTLYTALDVPLGVTGLVEFGHQSVPVTESTVSLSGTYIRDGVMRYVTLQSPNSGETQLTFSDEDSTNPLKKDLTNAAIRWATVDNTGLIFQGSSLINLSSTGNAFLSRNSGIPGNATITTIPELSTAAILILGLASVATLHRYRRTQL